ncbi:hypothetical protein ACEZDB_38735 [Streptacidiphilus sp. N1-3]|uniref:Uncharacterized protein n=1 Tax=Streptacidiphilus alkalitolerans TaxID=3342712 RepID=A0ABV6XEA2_9ACTN
MTTAPNPGVQNQMVPLPIGTQVRLQNGSTKTVLDHRYSGAANVLQYLVDKQKADWQSAKFCTVVQPDVTAPVSVPQPEQQAQPLPGGRLVAPATSHAIATDSDHPGVSDQKIHHTPGGLRAIQLEDRTRLFGPNVADHPQILSLTTVTDLKFTTQARLTIGDYQQDERGLYVNVLVEGVLDKVAVPYDLIEIVLTKPLLIPGKPTEDTQLETMLVVTPPVNENRIQFDAFYTWAQLARLLGLPTSGDLRHTVCTAFPQLGVEARWYERLASGTNGVNHTSGGNKLKDGSGQIAMRPITQEDRKASEVVRNTDWNLSEVLRASRPVYVSHQDLLQPGKEMATTLEAESEFLVEPGQYQHVLGKLTELLHTPGLWSKLGIADLECDDLDKESGQVVPRVSKDSYFDTPGLPLLTRGVVLRRREVPKKDKAGVYLFAVKGRMVALGGTGKERIRLASQVHLIDPVQQPRLERFLADKSVDNAFARVLDDALPGFDPSGVAIQLVVNSNRVKYTFTLENSTTVEFSADEATATFHGRSATLHCIEFGVGHPGLFIGQGSGTQGSGAQGSGTKASVAPVQQQPQGGTPLIMRPYHVPADLDNPALFDKRDYRQYQALRDSVLAYLFGTPEPKLELAGNKAQRLAQILGMTKEK